MTSFYDLYELIFYHILPRFSRYPFTHLRVIHCHMFFNCMFTRYDTIYFIAICKMEEYMLTSNLLVGTPIEDLRYNRIEGEAVEIF